jgi:hypothetical protein
MNQSMATEVVIHLQTGLSWMITMCYFEPSGQATAMDVFIPLLSPALTAAAIPQASRWRYVCLTTEAEDSLNPEKSRGKAPLLSRSSKGNSVYGSRWVNFFRRNAES